eukprot:6011341-Alexandrium_andersonii.AAC.1
MVADSRRDRVTPAPIPSFGPLVKIARYVASSRVGGLRPPDPPARSASSAPADPSRRHHWSQRTK